MKAGESVPEHTHRPGGEHITIVAAGSIRIAGPGFEKTLKAGELFDYADDQQTHSIHSGDDGAVVFNIPKGAQA